MNNQQIAQILYEIAEILEMQDVKFKPFAYRKAAQSIEALTRDIKEIYKEGKLRDIPGVGESISKKIEELIKTGKLKAYEKLKKKMPVNLQELGSIQGMGPKTIKKLYQKLKIKNLKELERAAKQGKIRKLEGLGEKREEEILENIGFKKKTGKRFLLGLILPEAEAIKNALNQLKEVKKIELTGSLRRMKETIGDVDILAVSADPGKTMDFFAKMNDVEKVLVKGMTKSSIRLSSGINADIRLVPLNSFGSALQYMTGNKSHNIKLRNIAKDKGLKLSEYGIFKGNKQVSGKTEEEVYRKLGLRYIEPELREDTGEIDAAKKNKLPDLINYNDVKGDLQMHTNYSDGNNTVLEMAQYAKKIGHKFIAITDHAGNLKIAGGMTAREITAQGKEINKIKSIKVFHGIEANIQKNGAIDVPDNILKDIDVVIAAIHSGFKQDKTTITNRLLTAMDNKHVNIIAHPTGRLLLKRKGYEFDLQKVFDKARERGIALEINAFPDRLDLDSDKVRLAVENKVKLSIGTDAHSTSQLDFYRLGIAVARRGWANKNDIINTYSIDKLEKFLKR